MMNICRYTPDRKTEWDHFVKMSKNGTFLFLRAYMDYHSDRFLDHSLMYYDERGHLKAIMPANEKANALYSHQGLTYGGLILPAKTHITEVGQMFEATIHYLREHGMTEWYYKQMPSVYHTIPAEEDEYWLWRYHAETIACNMMTAIDLRSKMDIVSARKRTYLSKLTKEGYTLDLGSPITDFWPILEENLMERFHATPVHSLQEILMLQERFPQSIVCCTVRNPEGSVVAGTLLFITDRVVRTQYISASPEGKKCNALDFLMLSLVKEYRQKQGYHYFEFGTSMADDGISLNEGLILQKEGFGGRSIACKTYKMQTI